MTCDTPWVLLSSAFFPWKLAILARSWNTDKNYILIHFFLILLTFDLLVCFNWHIYNIDDAWKIAAPGYYVITFVHDVANKTLSHDSNDTVDVLMWLTFVNSSIFMREVIIIWFFKDLTEKNDILEWCSWFKFNNLGMVLGMAKWSKLNSPFKEVAGEKNL